MLLTYRIELQKIQDVTEAVQEELDAVEAELVRRGR